MPKADPLIRTKLHLPFTRPGLVPRPRLQEQLLQGLRGPLTLVTAPAGFGKTTLVAAGVGSCDMPVAWLSLDKNDNQVRRFLSYLIAAVQQADQTLGRAAGQLLIVSGQAQPEVVLTSLINDLDGAHQDLVLVLDDYQFINNQAVHAAVAFLLDHLPRSLHLVIATRSDPRLPLARLRARAQMLELRAADLRFTEDEAAQFLNNVMGLHLDAASVASLEERTEGWIAGLQMAAISIQSGLSMPNRKDVHAFVKRFSGTNRYVLDYLLEEVLDSQPPEVQRFLLYTSVLDRLAAPLCDALLEEDGKPPLPGSPALRPSTALLEYLERANLFLVPLDNERQWYRYHHLFADLLKVRLHQDQPGIVPLLHIRASTWLEQSGLISEAIQHLFAAHEVGRAADLIEPHGHARWADNDPSVLEMADGLPSEILLARPKLGLYLAWLLICQGHIPRAVLLLKDLATRLTGEKTVPGAGWMQLVVGLAQAFLAPQSSFASLPPLPDEGVLDEIPPEELVLRDAAEILYAMALGRRGEIDRAAEFSVSCIEREKAARGMVAVPTLALFLARAYVIQGRLQAAHSLCLEYMEAIQEKGVRISSSAGSIEIVLGEVLYEWNDLDGAETYLCQGLQANKPWQNIMTDGFGQSALVRVLIAKGDYEGAMQTADRLVARLSASRPREFLEDLLTLRARVQLASGDLTSAVEWADRVLISEDYPRYQDLFTLTLARVRLAQGKLDDVEALLPGAQLMEKGNNRTGRQLEYQLLQAAAAAAQGRLPHALKILESCLCLAQPEGYVRAFLSIGEPVRELLAAYLRSNTRAHKAYAKKLLDAFSSREPAAPANLLAAGIVEPLSGRELEVLSLIALGKTNPEIARQLIVSPGTIKAHTASIYRKLDVSNRTEAVARARQTGLLT